MSMTLAQLRTIINGNTSRTDKDTLVTSYVNLVLVDIASRHDWLDLRGEATSTIASGAYTLTLPANILSLLDVRYIDGVYTRPIPVYPKTQVIKVYPSPSTLTASRPMLGYVEGSTLTFIPPTADTKSMTVTYVRKITALSGEADVLDLDGIDDAVTCGATAKLFRSLQQYTDALMWDKEYEKQLALAIEKDKARPEVEYMMQTWPPMGPTTIPPWLDPFSGFGGNI